MNREFKEGDTFVNKHSGFCITLITGPYFDMMYKETVYKCEANEPREGERYTILEKNLIKDYRLLSI